MFHSKPKTSKILSPQNPHLYLPHTCGCLSRRCHARLSQGSIAHLSHKPTGWPSKRLMHAYCIAPGLVANPGPCASLVRSSPISPLPAVCPVSSKNMRAPRKHIISAAQSAIQGSGGVRGGFGDDAHAMYVNAGWG